MPDSFVKQELTYPSALAAVDQAEEAVVAAARALSLDDDKQYEIGMAVRECMVNAVMHGNQQSAEKVVRVTLDGGPDRMTVIVEDEGAGLDLDAVANPTEGDNLLRTSGRGLLIIQAYVDEFKVERRVPRGTRVTMVKLR